MHCYDRPVDLPAGVHTFDASRLMPLSYLQAHKETGSIALGANRYRYRLIAEGFGLYADCDMFCLRQITDLPYIIGKEQDDVLNNAFLKYPINSDLAQALIDATQDYYFIPPWFRASKKRRLSIRRRLGQGVHVGEHPWGVWGPQLVSYFVKELGLWEEAAPIDRYYPVHPWQTTLLRDPDLSIYDLVTPRTEAIHLWHKMVGSDLPPKGSALWEVINC